MSGPIRSLCMKGYENRVFTALQSMAKRQAETSAALRKKAMPTANMDSVSTHSQADHFAKQTDSKAASADHSSKSSV